MKKAMVLLWCIISVIGLAACSKNGNPINTADNKDAGKTVLQMELDKNYDISDPFVNARLFAVSEDMAVLKAELSFQMEGESGIVEIKDNKTDEVLWENTWEERAENDTLVISLNNVQKDKEYAIWFTGTKIENAKITVTFENDLVLERERPES